MPRKLGALAATAAVAVAVAVASSPASTALERNGVIAFASNRGPDSGGELYAVSPRGAARRDLSRSGFGDSDPVVSPDGSSFAWVSNRSGRDALYVEHIDGRGARRVAAADADPTSIAWSPDGRRLAFDAGANVDIVSVRRAGLRRVGAGLFPSWSADGRRLAYVVARRGGNNLVAVARLDGRVVWRRRGTLPQWSPRGERLAFSLGSARTAHTTVTDARGTTLRSLRGSLLSWSPDGQWLALQRGTAYELVVASVHGGRGRSLGNDAFSAAWSPDSRRIAFRSGASWVAGVGGGARRRIGPQAEVDGWARGRILLSTDIPANDGPRSLMTVRPDGSGARQIASAPAGASVTSAAFARRGRTVVYRLENESPGGLLTIRPDGSGIRQLTHDGHGVATPAWSPDGKSIAFARTDVAGRCHGCDWRIAILRTATGALTQIDAMFADHPTWSSDGSRIAYMDFPDEGQRIFVVRADGTDRRLLGPGYEPSWSPDGNLIAFVNGQLLAVMNANGSNVRSLGVRGASPTWSPDGRWIAYVRAGGLSAVHPDGTGAHEIAETGRTTASVDWSPDGEWLVFAQGFDLYVIRADGTGRRRLTSGPALDATPAWQPVAGG